MTHIRANPYHVDVAIVICALFAICMLRLNFWRSYRSSRSSKFTAGMLLLAASYICSVPAVGNRRIDPMLDQYIGDNAADLIQVVLLAGGCYIFGVLSLQSLSREDCVPTWTVSVAKSVVFLSITSRISDQADEPLDDPYNVFDAASIAQYAILLILIAITCGLIVTSGVAGLRATRTWTARPSLIALSAAGICGIGYVATVSTLLVVSRAYLSDHYRTIGLIWGYPTLGLLAVGGIYGLIAARRQQLKTILIDAVDRSTGTG